MQKLGFVIIAHSEPGQVARLAGVLGTNATSVVVHVNANSDISYFRKTAPIFCQFVEKRVAVRWGTSSLLDAIIAATEHALRNTDADRIVLLSQSCLPLASMEGIKEFFHANLNLEFIGLRRMNRTGIDRWRLSFDMARNCLPQWFQTGLAGKLFRRTGIACPALDWQGALDELQPYKGCLWWALSRRACEHMIETIQNRPEIDAYAKSLFGPEEIIPHTILANSTFAGSIRHHITFEDWSRRGPSPKWLDFPDVQRLALDNFRWTDGYGSGRALFARKFPGVQPEDFYQRISSLAIRSSKA